MKGKKPNPSIRSYQTERFLRKIHGRSISPEINYTPFEITGDLTSYYQNKVDLLKEEWQLVKKTLSRCYSNCSQTQPETHQKFLRNFTSAIGFHKPHIVAKQPSTKGFTCSSITASCDNSQILYKNNGAPLLNESYDVSQRPRTRLQSKINPPTHNQYIFTDEYEAGTENITANKVLSSTPAKNMFLCNIAAHTTMARKATNEYSTIGKQQFVTYTMGKCSPRDSIKHISKMVMPNTCKVDESLSMSSTLRNNYFVCGKPCNSSMQLSKKEWNKENRQDSKKDLSLNTSKVSIKDIKGLTLLSISKVIKNREEARKSEMENVDCNKCKCEPVECIIACKAFRNSKAVKQLVPHTTSKAVPKCK
jgi:hypothetical protein